MATKFPKFSQALAQDPATRRIWYGIATAHDLEAHDGMTEENLYQKIFASHFGHLAIIFLWTSGNLFHVAWQGNFEKWVGNPLKVKPIAHSIWDPHFGESALKAFHACGCRDFSRVDFIICEDGNAYFLEVNTLPGLTETSLLPKSASCSGYDFDKLAMHLLQPAVTRFSQNVLITA